MEYAIFFYYEVLFPVLVVSGVLALMVFWFRGDKLTKQIVDERNAEERRRYQEKRRNGIRATPPIYWKVG